MNRKKGATTTTTSSSSTLVIIIYRYRRCLNKSSWLKSGCSCCCCSGRPLINSQLILYPTFMLIMNEKQNTFTSHSHLDLFSTINFTQIMKEEKSLYQSNGCLHIVYLIHLISYLLHQWREMFILLKIEIIVRLKVVSEGGRFMGNSIKCH